jgi:hypothetical protein
VANDPVNKIDPEGKDWKDWIPNSILCAYAFFKCTTMGSQFTQECREECYKDPLNPPPENPLNKNQSELQCAKLKCYQAMGMESCLKMAIPEPGTGIPKIPYPPGRIPTKW